ncbi:hypothetical protein ACHHYP_05552, partial [Achlya hypogyna]
MGRVLLSKTMQHWLGIVYLALSMGCSIWFLDIISPGLSNDLFWPGFEPTAAHTYLLDVFSTHLAAGGNAVVDLFDPKEAIVKVYGLSTTMAYSKPTYPRELALAQYISIQDAIARCDRDFASNGAVYLEPYLRNVHWSDWYAAYGSSFNFAVSDAIVGTNDDGVLDEQKYLSFQLQWSNDMQIGIQESVTVINMFGWEQAVTVTSIPFGTRSSMWTSFALNWVFYDDLWGAAVANASLVRSAPNFMGDATMEALLGLYPFTPCSVIIHDHIGPFQSVDMFLTSPPPSLISAVTALQSSVAIAIYNDATVLTSFRDLPTTLLDPVPLHWQLPNFTFFGGNPMCAFGAGATFVQPSFSFDDSCGTQVPTHLLVHPMPTLFATVSLFLRDAGVGGACQLCGAATTETCSVLTHATSTIAGSLLRNVTLRQQLKPILVSAIQGVQRMNVEIIQFALSPGGDSTVLRQPLLGGTSWDFFGYVALHEWATGLREVVSFQGDVAAHMLISERVEPIPFKVSSKEVPISTCRYLWTIVVLITCTLVAVAILTATYAMQTAYGLGLLQFNRVVGPVWVGRPLLLLRAVTAITALSTTPLRFIHADGAARFEFAPRPVMHTFILCGEAAWLTYVTNDILLVVVHQLSPRAAHISSIVVWIVLVILETVAPIRASATVDRACSRVNMEAQMVCVSGTVVVGSLGRGLVVLGVNAAVITLVYGLTWLLRARNKIPWRASPFPYLVSAGAEAFLAPVGDIWHLDGATAAMSGFLRFRWRSRVYIFDTKLWILYHNDIGSLGIAKSVVGPNASIATPPIRANYDLQSIVKLGAGLTYVAMTAAGSLSYIQLSTINLANDF